MFARKQNGLGSKGKKNKTTGLLNEPRLRYRLNFTDTPPRTRMFSPSSHISTAVKRPRMAWRRTRRRTRTQVCVTQADKRQGQNLSGSQSRTTSLIGTSSQQPLFTDVMRVFFACFGSMGSTLRTSCSLLTPAAFPSLLELRKT